MPKAKKKNTNNIKNNEKFHLMEDFIQGLKRELKKEVEDRNIANLELNKVIRFWEIERSKYEDAMKDLRIKDECLKDELELQRCQLQAYFHKTRHLIHEKKSELASFQIDHLKKIDSIQENYQEELRVLKEENYQLKAKLRKEKSDSVIMINQINLEKQTALALNKQEFINRVEEIESKSTKGSFQLAQELEENYKNQLLDLEERKNNHVQDLMEDHEKAFISCKSYFNDITLSSVSVIKNLKDRIEDLKNRSLKMSTEFKETSTKLTRAKTDLDRIQNENNQLLATKELYKKEVVSHNRTRGALKNMKSQVGNLMNAYTLSTERLRNYEELFESIEAKLENALMYTQQKISLMNQILEKKLDELTDQLQRREAQILILISALNADNETVSKFVQEKDDVIKRLAFDVKSCLKSYDGLHSVYEKNFLKKSLEIPTGRPTVNGNIR